LAGHALVERRGAAFVRASDQDICHRAASLHGPSVIGSALIPTLDRAARFLERGQIDKAKACIGQLVLPSLTPSGETLMRASWSRFSSVECDAIWRIAPRVFDPDKHPRWPAGSADSTGGQFMPGGTGSVVTVADEEKPNQPRVETKEPVEPEKLPELPTDRLPTPSELNRFGRLQSGVLRARVMEGMVSRVAAIAQIVSMLPDIVDNAHDVYSRVVSRFDEPMTLDKLIERTQSDPPPSWPGYEPHHIVEQGPNDKKIPDELLQGRENVVKIPYYIHRDISDWYSRPNPEYGGKTPRDFIRGKTFGEQYQFGLDAMRKFGALK
jgi:hypothetical protein